MEPFGAQITKITSTEELKMVGSKYVAAFTLSLWEIKIMFGYISSSLKYIFLAFMNALRESNLTVSLCDTLEEANGSQ